MLDTSRSTRTGGGAVLVELSVMEQRYQAVFALVQDGWKVVEVARRLGVSRQSVHTFPSYPSGHRIPPGDDGRITERRGGGAVDMLRRFGMDKWVVVEVPPAFGINLSTRKDQLRGYLTIKGDGFTPGHQVSVHLMNVPGMPVNVEWADPINADPNGHFEVTDDWPFLQNPGEEDSETDVHVYARDEDSGRFDVQSFKAGSVWVA
jgi:hypothetical protein